MSLAVSFVFYLTLPTFTLMTVICQNVEGTFGCPVLKLLHAMK